MRSWFIAAVDVSTRFARSPNRKGEKLWKLSLATPDKQAFPAVVFETIMFPVNQHVTSHILERTEAGNVFTSEKVHTTMCETCECVNLADSDSLRDKFHSVHCLNHSANVADCVEISSVWCELCRVDGKVCNVLCSLCMILNAIRQFCIR